MSSSPQQFALENILHISLHFLGDYRKSGTDYCFILCKISRKRERDFLECMDELVNVMLLTGHKDYVEFCGEVMNTLCKVSEKAASILSVT